MGQRMQAVCLLLPIEEGVVEGALCQAIPYRCQLSRRQEYEADVTLEKYLQNCDPKLHCLKNGDDQELSQNIERLLQEADPLIKKEIRSRLNPEEFEVK
jgi:collagenase-like PrtC family protease